MTIKKIDKKLNQQLDWLIEPSLQGVNTLFVLSFEDEAQKKKSYRRYYLRTVEINNYNIMIKPF